MTEVVVVTATWAFAATPLFDACGTLPYHRSCPINIILSSDPELPQI
jgi:hypothetical protein